MLDKFAKLFEESVNENIVININVGDDGSPVVDVQDDVNEPLPQEVIEVPFTPCDISIPDEDDNVLGALDDYFKTLNDGQYSPLSGENNNASNNTEVYHIAKKHGVDPSKLMTYLSDVAIFDKFQKMSIKEGRLDEYDVSAMRDKVFSKVSSKYREHMNSALKDYQQKIKRGVAKAVAVHSIASAYGLNDRVFSDYIEKMVGSLREESAQTYKPAKRRRKVVEEYADLLPPNQGELNIADKITKKYSGSRISQIGVSEENIIYVTDKVGNKFVISGNGKLISMEKSGINEHKGFDKLLDDFEFRLDEGKQRSAYEERLCRMLKKMEVDFECKGDRVYIQPDVISLINDKFPEYSGMIEPLVENSSGGASCAGGIGGFAIGIGEVGKRKVEEDDSVNVMSHAYQFINELTKNPHFVKFHALNSQMGGYYAEIELDDGKIYSLDFAYLKDKSEKKDK